MGELEKGFLFFSTESEEQDTPDDLLLCVNCRDSGHLFRSCTLSLRSTLEYRIVEASYILAIIGASDKVLSLPSRIALKPRKMGDALRPCNRYQNLPVLDLLASPAMPDVPKVIGSNVSTAEINSSGLI
jgi:hypothetical protein